MNSRRIELIVVHCSASFAGQDIGAREIREWHLDRGFAGIGYHYVIRLSGVVERGRSEDVAGAHAVGYNSHSIGVCLVGGIDENARAQDTFTPAQHSALLALLLELRSRYPRAYVLGHRDLPNVAKECPSFDVRAWCASKGLDQGDPDGLARARS